MLRWAILATFISMQAAKPAAKLPERHKTVYDYSLVSLDGKETPLSVYKGKVLLIVNLASQSIYKKQISALEDLQKTYADKGLILVGIPSGDFGGQELPDNAAIRHYYLDTEHVTFVVFAKSSLRGKDEIPLIRFLTDPKEGTAGGELHWNFTKFIVDREGKPVLRFEADKDPSDPEFRVDIEKILNGTFKKEDPSGRDRSASPSDENDRDAP